MFDIDRLEALHAAATPGEWESRHYGTCYEDDEDFLNEIGDGVQVASTAINLASCDRADSYFIAASHNAMPELIAELRQLREFERRVRRILDDIFSHRAEDLHPSTLVYSANAVDETIGNNLKWLDEQRKAER